MSRVSVGKFTASVHKVSGYPLPVQITARGDEVMHLTHEDLSDLEYCVKRLKAFSKTIMHDSQYKGDV